MMRSDQTLKKKKFAQSDYIKSQWKGANRQKSMSTSTGQWE